MIKNPVSLSTLLRGYTGRHFVDASQETPGQAVEEDMTVAKVRVEPNPNKKKTPRQVGNPARNPGSLARHSQTDFVYSGQGSRVPCQGLRVDRTAEDLCSDHPDPLRSERLRMTSGQTQSPIADCLRGGRVRRTSSLSLVLRLLLRHPVAAPQEAASSSSAPPAPAVVPGTPLPVPAARVPLPAELEEGGREIGCLRWQQ